MCVCVCYIFKYIYMCILNSSNWVIVKISLIVFVIQIYEYSFSEYTFIKSHFITCRYCTDVFEIYHRWKYIYLWSGAVTNRYILAGVYLIYELVVCSFNMLSFICSFLGIVF